MLIKRALAKYNPLWLAKRIVSHSIPTNLNVLITSDPRSGSTLLQELLQKQVPKSASIFEPLHLKRGAISDSLLPYFTNRSNIQHFPDPIRLRNDLDCIFSGMRLNKWTTMQSSTWEYLRAETYIIKTVRANQLLPWIADQFEMKYRPMYLVRHPIAVAMSKLKGKGLDEHFETPPSSWLRANCYSAFAPLLNKLETRLENIVFQWCINNHELLKLQNSRPSNAKWHTIFYENLLTGSDLSFLADLPAMGNATAQIHSRSLTSSDNYCANVDAQVEKWKSRLADRDRAKVQSILDFFEIRQYAASSAWPQT